MYHFFINKDQCFFDDNIAFIYGDDVKHIRDVIRLKNGEKILISILDLKEDYYAYIDDTFDDKIKIIFGEKKFDSNELFIDMHLFQALPKSDKMDYIIQKAVELGVNQITPVYTSRCIVKLDKVKEKKRLERWQTIAKEAAKQSKRSIIPKVNEFINFNDAVNTLKKYDKKYIPYEECDTSITLFDELENIKKDESISMIIGPEGGFTEEEISIAINNDVKLISLGKRILRTETASLCMLSGLMLKAENID